jgi:hypothetical protein
MTAENILNEWLLQTDNTHFKEGHYFVIKQAMKEFASLKCKELLEIVAEKAETREMFVNGSNGGWYDKVGKVNKDSILNAVDLKEFIK